VHEATFVCQSHCASRYLPALHEFIDHRVETEEGLGLRIGRGLGLSIGSRFGLSIGGRFGLRIGGRFGLGAGF
jgi:hypothetical protein